MEIQQITELVQAAVGYKPSAQDQVTVISRKFSTAADAPATGRHGMRPPGCRWLARNATALLIALLVLFLGVRPIAKALMKKRDDTPAGQKLAFTNPVPRLARGPRGQRRRRCRRLSHRIGQHRYARQRARL